ncbi:hypothetical protein [Craterilacuibacter sinensis]|uniref:WYL domain-containing protein n=1 Tax=Craterilacuibacter sinensis TaxID=2686017 RepID=A0A845BTT2_9NEIS|nr:hypothetical protein [Craterilacuibacter sinensis]MXR38001.1 hypothetical protein [Craterilacuibacter sinensis]
MVAFFGLLLFAGTFYFAWVAMAADLKQRGKSFLIRHLVGFVFANIVAGMVIALLSADSPSWWQWLLSLAIVGGMFVQAKGGAPATFSGHNTSIISKSSLNKLTSSQRSDVHNRAKKTSIHTGMLDELRQLCRELVADGTLDDEEIHSLHRWLISHQQVKQDELARLLSSHLDEVLEDGEISVRESLDVLDLVEALAQGKSFADMHGWQALAPLIENEPPKVKRRQKKQSQSRITGNRLDAIRFSYLNADGKFSDRSVVVRVLDDEYFQGVCQSRRALRTFRLDRVIGQVTSEDTGEVDDAFSWAESVKEFNKSAI